MTLPLSTPDRADLALAHLCRELLDHPRGRSVLAALSDQDLRLADWLQLLTAALGDSPAVGWHQIGHPAPTVCLEMAGEIERLAGRLEGNADATATHPVPHAVTSWPCSWECLIGVATMGRMLPIDFQVVVRMLGPSDCAARLRAFACRMRSAVLVG